MPDLPQAIRYLQDFTGSSLTQRVAGLEAALANADAASSLGVLEREGVSRELLASAYLLKRTAGQINVVIHTLGILLLLPHLLEPDERVQYLSLGAGNTGKAFDLETTHRVAEFKFIHWQGGSETIRQNVLFKDFFRLAEHRTRKRKFLYVLETERPLRFFRGRRSLASVMSRNSPLLTAFRRQFGDRFTTVGEYFTYRGKEVSIQDVSGMLSELIPPEGVFHSANEI